MSDTPADSGPTGQQPEPPDQLTLIEGQPAATAARLAPASGEPAVPLGRVGDYELQSEIGRGGIGVVFRARHVMLYRIAALQKSLCSAPSHHDELPRCAMP